MARATHICNDVYQVENKVKFPTAEALRGVNSVIFDAQGSRLANELGRRVYVTGTALEQGCDLDKAVVVQRQATVQNIDIPVSAQRQNPSKSKRFQQTIEIPQLEDSEDHGDSPVAVHCQSGRCQC